MRQRQHLLVLVQDSLLIWKLGRLRGLGEMARSPRMTLATLRTVYHLWGAGGALGVGIFLSSTLRGAGMRQWQHLLVLVQDSLLIWKLRLHGLGEMA
jgi:hypothetical protein